MPQGRPHIPAEVERQILSEAGHRCAVCGAELPLERAHIFPWAKSRDHSAGNLICLCANCHSRSHAEAWSEETLRGYKERPWVVRARLQDAAGAVSVPALHQLPTPPADFTGRDGDLTELQGLAENGSAALFGIYGMGGIGKTALALKLAERLTPRYPDAQVYLDLKGMSASPLLPAQAMAYVIRAFRPEARLPESGAEIAALYRSVLHGRRALLLMDNAVGQTQVEPLIPPAGNFLVLTSRPRFHLPGIRVKHLAELPLVDSANLLLQIEPRIGDVADRIAKICAGLPFALRNAAGTLSARSDLSPVRYAEELAREEARCGLVDASMSLSYNLLSEDLAARWRALAVFPSDFDISAASDVWDLREEEAVMVLGDLVIWSLLQGSEGRYWLHDLARAFAGGRLQAEEKSRAERRHSKHYLLEEARIAEAFMDGNELDALRAFDADWSNIQAGFWNAVQESQDDGAATLAVLHPIACQPFLTLRLHPYEALNWLNTVLPLADRLGNQFHAANILNAMGLVLRETGKHDGARVRFEEALAAASGLENALLEGTILGNLGHELLFLGDPEQARIALERALSIAREACDARGELVAVAGLERLYSELRDYPRALDFAQQWLAASRQSGQRHSEGQALGNMGVTLMHLGEPQRAVECFEADLGISRELGDQFGQAASLGNLGWAHAELGDLKKAVALLESRIAISRRLGDMRGEAESSWTLGWVYEEMGDIARAVQLLQVRADYQHAINHPGAEETDAEITALRSRLGDASV